jgi:hypothetical protein
VLFLFDANVLITAGNTYYPIDQIPEFWSWIEYQGSIGNIKLPLEIIEEILAGGRTTIRSWLGWTPARIR